MWGRWAVAACRLCGASPGAAERQSWGLCPGARPVDPAGAVELIKACYFCLKAVPCLEFLRYSRFLFPRVLDVFLCGLFVFVFAEACSEQQPENRSVFLFSFQCCLGNLNFPSLVSYWLTSVILERGREDFGLVL